MLLIKDARLSYCKNYAAFTHVLVQHSMSPNAFRSTSTAITLIKIHNDLWTAHHIIRLRIDSELVLVFNNIQWTVILEGEINFNIG